MNQTIENPEVKEPTHDEKLIHLRLEALVKNPKYLCGAPVDESEPGHGYWHPASPHEVCPHCGRGLCPECVDLARLFSQLEPG